MNPVGSFPSPDELGRYVAYTGESDNIDAKGPTKWDNGVESAKLAKDIAAFGNSRDGGVLVIGKEEPNPGEFLFPGLTEEQAASFDTTKVATWVNIRFSPPIRLVCHRQQHEGRLFVVITVAEFDDTPALCVKSFDNPADPKNPILRARTIYVRNANAASAPLESVEELRSLIGLATKKRADDMLARFHAMLKGKPLLNETTDNDVFEKQLAQVWSDLDLDAPDQKNRTMWRLSFRPASYDPNRWSERATLEKIVREKSIHVYDSFPAWHHEISGMPWGIASSCKGETWALTRSGLFAFSREFHENNEAFDHVRPGEGVALQWNVLTLMEFFMFLGRFTDAYQPGETIVYQIAAGALKGKCLFSVDPRVRVREAQACRAQEFSFTKAVSAEELRASWEDYCAEAMREFFQLFDSRIETAGMRAWVETFKARRF